ncbi:hypothetical protein SGRIM119S_01783 [Streptomyces griseorubiginosus]
MQAKQRAWPASRHGPRPAVGADDRRMCTGSYRHHLPPGPQVQMVLQQLPQQRASRRFQVLFQLIMGPQRGRLL